MLFVYSIIHRKCSKTFGRHCRSRDQFLLLSMKINEENKYTLFCIRAISGVLQGVNSNIFLGANSILPLCYAMLMDKGQMLSDNFTQMNSIKIFSFSLDFRDCSAIFDLFCDSFCLGFFLGRKMQNSSKLFATKLQTVFH